jgi:hypothetical protein
MKGLIIPSEYGNTLKLYGSDGKLTDVFALENIMVDTIYGAISLQTLIEVYEFVSNFAMSAGVQILHLQRR